jgi:hypothetical protein
MRRPASAIATVPTAQSASHLTTIPPSILGRADEVSRQLDGNRQTSDWWATYAAWAGFAIGASGLILFIVGAVEMW